MNNPIDLKYTKDHEWLRSKGKTAQVGVTAYAIEQLGDIVHIELPKVGDVFKQNAPFGTIESTKTVSDLYMPVTCKVVAVNDILVGKPEKLQADAYNEGWLIEVEIQNNSELSGLMNAAEYEKIIS